MIALPTMGEHLPINQLVKLEFAETVLLMLTVELPTVELTVNLLEDV